LGVTATSDGPSLTGAGGAVVVVVGGTVVVVGAAVVVVGATVTRVVGGMVAPGWRRVSRVVVGAGTVVSPPAGRSVVVGAGAGAFLVVVVAASPEKVMGWLTTELKPEARTSQAISKQSTAMSDITTCRDTLKGPVNPPRPSGMNVVPGPHAPKLGAHWSTVTSGGMDTMGTNPVPVTMTVATSGRLSLGSTSRV
jgi:hypothetical protein